MCRLTTMSKVTYDCATCPVLKAVEEQKQEIERLKAKLGNDDRLPLKSMVVECGKAKTVPLRFLFRKLFCYAPWFGAMECIVTLSDFVQLIT